MEHEEWVVELCSCGFGGGDFTDEADSLEEIIRVAESYERYTNASVIALVSPQGKYYQGRLDYATTQEFFTDKTDE